MTRRPRLQRRVHRTGALAAACLVAAGCTVNSAPTPTSLVPLVDPAALPIATDAPTTTAGQVIGPVDPLLTAIPQSAACAYDDALDGGEVTFLVAGRLYGVDADGTTVRCLLEDAGDRPVRIRWSPAANRTLLGPAVVFDVNGVRSTGYDESNERVQWEYPVGDTLLAPSSSSYTLGRRSAIDAGSRTDVTFLGITVVAASHTSGRAILAAGLTADREEGVFIADMSGDDRRMLATVGGDTTFLELLADPSGTSALVLSARGDTSRIHRIALADLAIDELVSQPTRLQSLTPGPSGDTLAWRAGLCNSMTTTWLIGDNDESAAPIGEGTALQSGSVAPIGWLDASRLVVAAREFGCDGPADLWIWNVAERSATLLVEGVDSPAVRLVQRRTALPDIDETAQPGVL